ncbi:Bacterial alpha-L-rhamnosidase [Emericellopsis cladophorae]|uniref:Bacterial alpha-L-rhamnosidase n=1 Tax=Emericellopsis cladophorae TaxID=2686198 RepID=A0A9P9XV03_9HYPO|nr:Bacterial alpha-L-rhamnosidase [Emericellopsis cladophorae]KAI6778171.1 Bacterial alpha-L-rhamnosidase [Emericellopsis cladophorae]
MAAPTPAYPLKGGPQTRWNMEFAGKAEELKPTLHRWPRRPQNVIRFVEDETQYFGIRPSKIMKTMQDFEASLWARKSDFILDFGIHMVGYLSMRLDSHGSHMDAPCRLRLTFGESPFDVTMGMDNVKTWISTSWLPDEIVNIDMCPEILRMPRRHSFRYLRVEIIDMSPKCKLSFSDISCECVSAIGPSDKVDAYAFKNTVLDRIDQVSLMTLRDCMQTVFEDGPRRDKRLWLGDLRLQALANYKSFKDFNLVKRCIYQFAAIVREDDSVPACLFEHPVFTPSDDYIVDYDALFAVVVYDYVEASGDIAIGKELWPTVLGCLKKALSHLDPETGLFDPSRGDDWKFLDWQEDLDRSAGSHGLLLYCLKATNKLALLLGQEPPHEHTAMTMTEAAKALLNDEGLVVSGPNAQISYASAAWLALSGAFPQETARTALLKTLDHPDAIRPLTPYLWHYVCEALADVGCKEECIKVMEGYWGKMIEAGADTFWECFDPENRTNSPYGDVRNNSFCHAWSCTPTYLLRGKLASNVLQDQVPKATTVEELDDSWIAHTSAELEKV